MRDTKLSLIECFRQVSERMAYGPALVANDLTVFAALYNLERSGPSTTMPIAEEVLYLTLARMAKDIHKRSGEPVKRAKEELHTNEQLRALLGQGGVARVLHYLTI